MNMKRFKDYFLYINIEGNDEHYQIYNQNQLNRLRS